MQWTICFSNKAKKQAQRLSERVLLVLRLLVQDLQSKGSTAGSRWPNYGKLKGKRKRDLRHCHLTKGKSTYVCCWEVIDKKQKIIEVYYVGTHEQAPY